MSDCESFLHRLALHGRVLVFGHAAIQALGIKAHRHSIELWLDPTLLEQQWVEAVIQSLPEPLPGQPLLDLVQSTGSIQISLDGKPVLISRTPADLGGVSFDESWQQGSALGQQSRYASVLDLYMTRINTGLFADLADLNALEELIPAYFSERLPQLDGPAAIRMLNRFAAPNTLNAARHHPAQDVRDHARTLLEEFTAQGDPFSADLLADWPA
jgi:hypothetical protein